MHGIGPQERHGHYTVQFECKDSSLNNLKYSKDSKYVFRCLYRHVSIQIYTQITFCKTWQDGCILHMKYIVELYIMMYCIL